MVQLIIKTDSLLPQHKPLSKFEDYILLEFQGSLQFNPDLNLQGKELGKITQFNEVYNYNFIICIIYIIFIYVY